MDSLPLPHSPSHPLLANVCIDGIIYSGLWAFLASWRSLFDRFDEDKSGSISFDEYTNALMQFGYRLSSSFVNLLYTTYDKSGEGRMSFDLFVQSCIILKRMTDVFKRYDEDRDGYITLSFEEFLTGEFGGPNENFSGWGEVVADCGIRNSTSTLTLLAQTGRVMWKFIFPTCILLL